MNKRIKKKHSDAILSLYGDVIRRHYRNQQKHKGYVRHVALGKCFKYRGRILRI